MTRNTTEWTPEQPFAGNEDVVVGCVTQHVLKAHGLDLSEFMHNINRVALQNATRVLKQIRGTSATLEDLERFLNDSEFSDGVLGQLPESNWTRDIKNYFANDYYSSKHGHKFSTKTFEFTYAARDGLAILNGRGE